MKNRGRKDPENVEENGIDLFERQCYTEKATGGKGNPEQGE